MKFDIIKTVNFITRDTTGQLYGFEKRPTMIHIAENNHYWIPKNGGCMIFIRERNDSLSFIEASDKEPWVVDVIEDSDNKSVIELINRDNVYRIDRRYGVISVIKEERIKVINDEPVFTSSQSIETPKGKIRKFIDRIVDKIKS